MKPIVAIVGRPNVGKSTLFNKLIGRRKAVVVDEPGVTRDLNYGDVEELGRTFTLVDTGGFEPYSEDIIFKQVREQAELAIEDADLIVLLMDGRAGVLPQDRELVGMLRKVEKPVVYAVNKVDSTGQEAGLADFYSLGIEELIGVSAEHGRNLNDLLDAVIERLPEKEAPEEDEGRVRVAILGRPNAGKSSILNRLIGKKRAIVSDVAGTTRDAVDTPYELEGRKYLFIDTAGIRKKNKISMKLESYCVMEAIKSIDRCDVAVLVIDANEAITGQDEKIAGLIEDRGKCCVIVVNKWDLVEEKETLTTVHMTETVRQRLPFVTFAPVLFISALTGQRVTRIIETVDTVVAIANRRTPTATLNTVLDGISKRHRPPVYRGRSIKFYYITQTGVAPPAFVVFTNWPEGVDETYKRYVTSRLRESLGLDIVPLRVHFRKRH